MKGENLKMELSPDLSNLFENILYYTPAGKSGQGRSAGGVKAKLRPIARRLFFHVGKSEARRLRSCGKSASSHAGHEELIRRAHHGIAQQLHQRVCHGGAARQGGRLRVRVCVSAVKR